MKNETNTRLGRHCVFLMHVNLVFATKYRRKIFDQDAIEKLRGYFASVCADFDVELVEMDGGVVVAHQYLLSASTLSNRKHRVS